MYLTKNEAPFVVTFSAIPLGHARDFAHHVPGPPAFQRTALKSWEWTALRG